MSYYRTGLGGVPKLPGGISTPSFSYHAGLDDYGHRTMFRPYRIGAQAPEALIVKEGDHISQFAVQKANFAEHRGFDVDANQKMIPKMTNSDAIRLIEYWTNEADGVDGLTDSFRWASHAGAALATAHDEPADTPYPRSAELWAAINRRAIDLESVGAIPSKWNMISEAVVESIKELPGRIRDAADWVFPDWLTPLLWVAGIGIGGLGLLWLLGPAGQRVRRRRALQRGAPL